ncbi:hypothetical protein GCM10012287_03780 [Streptomyces daqingensis]|jgi:hypothetical protein|uniref:Uncharacterized protein n=1 Tax=Streptomyces daqingensis TaxID=1472640 RepID=A0ABQ2LSA0_9ACTN|nr:hypothetical protein [Streptomyces daqingensis]GGO42576.1 hypothetical protein GCM10012287_03780 [Streptomyces daqingensis]
MGEGFSAVPESIDGSAHLLLEIAGLLEQGSLDGDVGTMARVPRSHEDVSAAVLDFARFADDQGQDLAALLTALSTLLKATGNNYTAVESSTAAALKDFVDSSVYVAPEGN